VQDNSALGTRRLGILFFHYFPNSQMLELEYSNPKGTSDNGPAFQRRDRSAASQIPKGRLNREALQPSLWDFACSHT
jgi:hypothetical protein